MSFLAPAAFALAILLPVIIIMYLLKLRRTEQVVSSVYLWRKMVRDVEANAPWQRLRRNLLLILQLLFLITLILALARPFTWVSGYSGQSAILVVDASASMSATDITPDRLEAAKRQAHQITDNLPEDARITVISAGIKAQVMVASSLDRRQVHQAIDNIHAQMGGSDMGVAMQLASAIAARLPDTQLIILSDGRVTIPQTLAIKGDVRYSPIGISGDNQAIGLLNAQVAPGGESVTAFAQVINYSSQDTTRRLGIYADGQLFNVYDLAIKPGEAQPVLAEGLPGSTSVVEAKLLDGENVSDVLPVDDQAIAVIQRNQPAKVTLVTQGNHFLEIVLGLLPNLIVTRPDDQNSLPAADLTIFDAIIPLTATLPSGNLLFIAPPRSTDFFTITGALQQPVPLAADPDETLLKHIALEGINILDAANIALPGWARPVIVTEIPGQVQKAPLLFVGEINAGRRVAVLAFDLRHSDLPLQIAFPLLLANLTQWLAPGSAGEIPTQVAPGDPVTLNVPAIDSNGLAISEVTITHPDNSITRQAVESGQVVFTETTQPGLYRINFTAPNLIEQSGTVLFAVNLFSPQESAIDPADNLPITGAQVAGEQSASEQRARREWWRPWALLALALLCIEWLVYQRNALAFMVNRFRQRWQSLRSVSR